MQIMANIAYVRVSSVDQNEERQIEALKKYEIDKWFVDKISAKNTNRPQLQAMLEYSREGDVIFIQDFSRLARSTMDLLKIVQDLEQQNITLISLKENIDTSTPVGKLMLTMIGAINEFERANLKERQAEGIAIAKNKGKYKGRKKIPKPDNFNAVYADWKNREITGKKAMELLNLKKDIFYKFIKEHEEELKK